MAAAWLSEKEGHASGLLRQITTQYLKLLMISLAHDHDALPPPTLPSEEYLVPTGPDLVSAAPLFAMLLFYYFQYLLSPSTKPLPATKP